MKNELKKLELYLHIPFCVKKCAYCDFLSAPATDEVIGQYTKALCVEIRRTASALSGYKVISVFIGGGTPSVLSADRLRTVLSTVRGCFTFSERPEITVECNPGTLDADRFTALEEQGVNRLSLGLQSADNEELKLLGRIHTYEEFLDTYRSARKKGFCNINIDLMQALPSQSVYSWEQTLLRVLDLKPEHLSVYGLMIEKETAFYERYHTNPGQLPSEEENEEMSGITEQLTAAAGYLHYEISNYARPGFECLHNTGYWRRTEYLGLGLGASSLFLNHRYENTRNLDEYLQEFSDTNMRTDEKSVRRNDVLLTIEDCMEEFMFLGLRMTEGISCKEFRRLFGKSYEEVYAERTKQLCRKQLLLWENDRVRLTGRGRDVSNVVLSEFLLDRDKN